MKNQSIITILVILIAIFSIVAASTGIFTNEGPGNYEFLSIRGKTIQIYGKGMYHHMSKDVAIQGIAQDYVTLFLGVPLLILALILARKGSLRSIFFLAGILNYFLVTYLFYSQIAMYNALFLVYVFLTSAAFFALALVILSIKTESLPGAFHIHTPVRSAGAFLITVSIMIALLWLSAIVPPLLDGTIIPAQVEHYTSLPVQAFDLSLLLPLSFVGGLLLIKKKPFGYLISTITLVFLPLLMTALTAKIYAMAVHGVNVIPAIFIIPAILVVALYFGAQMLKSCGIGEMKPVG